jgi:hypothetical protein
MSVVGRAAARAELQGQSSAVAAGRGKGGSEEVATPLRNGDRHGCEPRGEIALR